MGQGSPSITARSDILYKTVVMGDSMYGNNYRRRNSLRLKGYNYSRAGAYFITICTANRKHLFGRIHHGVMHLNEYGKIAHKTWAHLSDSFPSIRLDAFVIMPNHIHGIIILKKHAQKKPSIPQIISWFKSRTSRQINYLQNSTGTIWHRSYHDRIIRDKRAFRNIRKYILNNPKKWRK